MPGPHLLDANQITIIKPSRLQHQQFSLTLRAGECWGLIGANGTGKTTLLHLLAGLSQQQDKLSYCNTSFQQLSPQQRAQRLGLLLQQAEFDLALSVYEFLIANRYPYHGLSCSKLLTDQQLIEQVMQQLELTGLASRQISTLSGGEQQRLAIAALCCQQPRIYLLDEPLNHIDIKYQVKVLRLLKALCQQQAAVLFSAHDVNSVAGICSHAILLFQDGSIIQGRVEDVLNQTHLSQLYDYPINHSSNTTSNCYFFDI